MVQAKRNAAGFGLFTAAICAGGETPGVTANTESYNGTSWTEVNNMNTSRRALGGSGIQTLGIVYAGTTGSVTGATESWDGTSWTEVADVSTARSALAGLGTTNVGALAIGGEPSPATEEWNISQNVKTITD